MKISYKPLFRFLLEKDMGKMDLLKATKISTTIVMIGSVNQYKQNPQLMVYAATKSAPMNFVQTMARELAEFGITVNNIAPGVILTPRNEQALSDEEYKAKIYSKIPCGYAGIPEDIAPAALLLCSDEGRYITGTDMIIDGGMHL